MDLNSSGQELCHNTAGLCFFETCEAAFYGIRPLLHLNAASLRNRPGCRRLKVLHVPFHLRAASWRY